MAEIPETDAMIAKELTITAVQRITGDYVALRPDKAGDTVGKMYKEILKNVREAMHEKKYE